MKLQNVKGTKDFLPEEQNIRNDIGKVLKNIMESYGFMPLETPTLCYFDLLGSKYGGGAEILKEVYKLNDQGNRQLGLRYDLTVPFAKVIGLNPYINMPFKRYEIGKVFRDGPVKKGRAREFIQCDVDVVGVKTMIAEAELMSMALEAFEKLSLDVYVKYNNRKLLYGILTYVGIEKENFNNVILSLDKIDKIGKIGVEEELIENQIEEDIIKRIFSILEYDNEDILEFFMENYNNSFVEEGVKEILELREYISELGLLEKVRFNPFLARGLDIYTGTIYEVFLSDGSIASSLAAGGRYDNIIGEFLKNGREYPAVGLSFGLDVVYTALTMKNKYEKNSIIDVFFIPLGTERKVLKIANNLRKNGLKVDIDMSNKSLGKALKTADKKKIPYVIILGENEIKENKVSIRNMKNGETKEINISDICNYIKDIRND